MVCATVFASLFDAKWLAINSCIGISNESNTNASFAINNFIHRLKDSHKSLMFKYVFISPFWTCRIGFMCKYLKMVNVSMFLKLFMCLFSLISWIYKQIKNRLNGPKVVEFTCSILMSEWFLDKLTWSPQNMSNIYNISYGEECLLFGFIYMCVCVCYVKERNKRHESVDIYFFS